MQAMQCTRLVWARPNVRQLLNQTDLIPATSYEVLVWIYRSRRGSCPETRLRRAPFRPQRRMQPRFSTRSLPMISVFFVPRGAALYLFLAARLARAATDGGRPLVDNIDRSPIPEIFRVFREVTSTLRAVTKLGGAIELVAPGSLPNDGKVISDERGPA
jgi:hypothetical protein